MSSRPQFSVILPVYNGADMIGRAIESVMAQSDPDWEIVAVDDGSTDESWDVLIEICRQEPRVRAVRIGNSGGPARPRNTAIAEARGRALCFLDQDDWWLPDKLSLQRPLLNRPEVGIVYGDAWIEQSGQEPRLYSEVWGSAHSGAVAAALIEANFIPALTAVVPVSVARAVGPLDERLVGVDDYQWWLRITMAGYRAEAVAQPVAVYTVASHNLSHDHDLYLRSLDACLRGLADTQPSWRQQLLDRREVTRLHAFDYYANRLADGGLTQSGGLRAATRVAPLVRSWPEAKRTVASALPPWLRRWSLADDPSGR